MDRMAPCGEVRSLDGVLSPPPPLDPCKLSCYCVCCGKTKVICLTLVLLVSLSPTPGCPGGKPRHIPQLWHPLRHRQTAKAVDNMCERGVRHQGLAFVSTTVNIPWRYFVGACQGDNRGGGGGAVSVPTRHSGNLDKSSMLMVLMHHQCISHG